MTSPPPDVTGSADTPPVLVAAHGSPARATGVTGTDVMLLTMAAIWGVNFSMMKFALGSFSPLAFNSVRVTIAGIALAAVAFAPGARQPSPRDAKRLMLLGL